MFGQQLLLVACMMACQNSLMSSLWFAVCFRHGNSTYSMHNGMLAGWAVIAALTAVSLLMCAGSENFGPLMAFMEEILGEGFLNELDLRHPMAMLMMEVICDAAATREWGEEHSLPEPVLSRTLQVLGELYENVPDFLSGGPQRLSMLYHGPQSHARLCTGGSNYHRFALFQHQSLI